MWEFIRDNPYLWIMTPAWIVGLCWMFHGPSEADEYDRLEAIALAEPDAAARQIKLTKLEEYATAKPYSQRQIKLRRDIES